ncbi:unnamed protein product [Acidithrix sp. C25]|nr:unnamed protein product [Acidithrix sp. C25]
MHESAVRDLVLNLRNFLLRDRAVSQCLSWDLKPCLGRIMVLHQGQLG